ncbi:hypothetical protein X727_32030 [Mesorhizobium sp. L103C119B0]|nr:hypothetical protein X768_17130 [Mesorhizobium sp. LSJC265A00]ESZ56279.1 hypothetical protein X728_25675 [Mesorhizobium sp. L103C120A0]ESZ58263.1 hypothetical protein X727_32030 [Mesorhizobium sp. L103C119B0]
MRLFRLRVSPEIEQIAEREKNLAELKVKQAGPADDTAKPRRSVPQFKYWTAHKKKGRTGQGGKKRQRRPSGGISSPVRI